MKKVLFLMLLAATIFTSCKKDGEDENGIVGKWNIIKDDIEEIYNGAQQDAGAQYYDEGDYMEVFANNTLKTFIDGDTENGKWRLENDGKRFVMIDPDGDEYNYEVLTLSKSALVLYEEIVLASNHSLKVTTTFSR